MGFALMLAPPFYEFDLRGSNNLGSFVNSFAYKTDVDLSTWTNSNNTSVMIPLQGANYKGRKFYANLEVYGTCVYSNKSWHGAYLIQKKGINTKSRGWPSKADENPIIFARYFESKKWTTYLNILERYGMFKGYYGKSELYGEMKNSEPMWMITQNTRYWHGSGFRIKGTFYYD